MADSCRICPLGITIDIVDRLLLSIRKKTTPCPCARNGPYPIPDACVYDWFVAFVFWLSPVALATRFYGTVLLPIARFFLAEGLTGLRVLAKGLDITSLDYAVIMVPQFTQVWATGFILLLIFSGGLFFSRFFCRYLCPSGAVFSLFSFRPLLRRNINEKCNDCGKCRKQCPMDAIDTSYREADTTACIVCGTCEQICPSNAVSFSVSGKSKPVRFSRPRRDFMAAAAAGAGASLLTLSNASGFYLLTGKKL